MPPKRGTEVSIDYSTWPADLKALTVKQLKYLTEQLKVKVADSPLKADYVGALSTYRSTIGKEETSNSEKDDSIGNDSVESEQLPDNQPGQRLTGQSVSLTQDDSIALSVLLKTFQDMSIQANNMQVDTIRSVFSELLEPVIATINELARVQKEMIRSDAVHVSEVSVSHESDQSESESEPESESESESESAEDSTMIEVDKDNGLDKVDESENERSLNNQGTTDNEAQFNPEPLRKFSNSSHDGRGCKSLSNRYPS